MSSALKFLRRAILPAIALFFVLAAAELWRRLRSEPIQVSPGWLIASGLALAVGNSALAVAFMRVLRRGGTKPLSWLRVFELYYRGLLARYLPGKVGIPAVRMAAAAEFGVSPVFMAGTVVMESLASVATSGAVAASISMGPWAPLAFRGVTDKPWALPLIATVCLGVMLLAVIDLRHYPEILRRFLRAQDRAGALLPVAWIVGCVVAWLCVGLACALCARALGEAEDVALLAAAGGVLGPIVGFLAVVAPGGLGVREAFLIMVLSPVIGGTRALAFGLVSRAMTLLVELMLWVIARTTLALRRAD
jgi:hypothetical protein